MKLLLNLVDAGIDIVSSELSILLLYIMRFPTVDWLVIVFKFFKSKEYYAVRFEIKLEKLDN